MKYKKQPTKIIITVDKGSKTNRKIIIPIIIISSESKPKNALVACFKLSVSWVTFLKRKDELFSI